MIWNLLLLCREESSYSSRVEYDGHSGARVGAVAAATPGVEATIATGVEAEIGLGGHERGNFCLPTT